MVTSPFSIEPGLGEGLLLWGAEVLPFISVSSCPPLSGPPLISFTGVRIKLVRRPLRWYAIS